MRNKLVSTFFTIFLLYVSAMAGHFTPPSSNYLPMSLHILEAHFNGAALQAGDEIASFDGSVCTGVLTLDGSASTSSPKLLIAYKQQGGDTGYTEGHAITFKIWDASENLEINVQSDWVTALTTGGSPIANPTYVGGESIVFYLNDGVTTPNPILTMVAGTGGTTSPTPGTHTYSSNETVNIQAIPSTGYQFSHWEGDVDDTNSASTTVTMDASKTVTAHFTIQGHTVSMHVNPASSGTTVPTIGDTVVAHGSTINISATALPGYQFSYWSSSDILALGNTSQQQTTLTVNADITVTAHFTCIQHSLTMAVTPSNGGTTTPPIGQATTCENSVIPIEAHAATGYHFVEWNGPVANSGSATTTVTITSDVTVTAVFAADAPDQKTLTLAVNNTTYGTTNPVPGTHQYNLNETVTLTATANPGYSFSHWIGNVANNSSASTTVTMSDNQSVTAVFSCTERTLTLSVDQPGSGSVFPEDSTACHGSVIMITATPAPGYIFENWSGDILSIENASSATTLATLNSDVDLTAHFRCIEYPLTMSVDPVGAGSTSPAVGTHNYCSGAVIDISATPAHAGYEFDYWSGPVANPNNANTTVTLTAAENVIAHFSPVSFNLNIQPSSGGTTSPVPGTYTHNFGQAVSIQATPQTGYHFVQWNSPNPADLAAIANINHSTTTITIDSDKTIYAEFARNEYTLTLTANPSDKGTTNPQANVAHTFYHGDTAPIEALAVAGWHFVNWTGATVADQFDSTTTILMDGNKAVTANFAEDETPQYNLTVGVNNAAWGTTVPTVGTGAYDENTMVQVSAHANTGYRFVRWDGPVNAANDSATFVFMDGDKTIQAVFEAIPQYTLSMSMQPSNGSGGSILPAAGNHTFYENTFVNLQATPVEGYRFVRWDGGVDSPTSPTTGVTMNQNKFITAIFEALPVYSLTILPPDDSNMGSTNPGPGVYSYYEGQMVTVEATAVYGYEFVNWNGDINMTIAALEFPMTTDLTLKPFFALAPDVTLTLSQNVDSWGDVSPSVGTHTYKRGDVVTLKAMPASGFSFNKWQGDVADIRATETTIIMTEDKTVTAVYGQMLYDLYVSPQPVSGGTTVPSGYGQYKSWTNVPLEARPAPGYKFTGWSGDVDDRWSATTFIQMTGDEQVVANFALAEKQILTLAVSPSEGGSTTPAIGSHEYNLNSTATITATPAQGFRFKQWVGDVANQTQPTTTIYIDSDKQVTAEFEAIPPQEYNLTISTTPVNGGTTTPTAGTYAHQAGSVVSVTATAASGYRFVSWSGPVTNPTNPVTSVLMDQDKSITANFQVSNPTEYTVTLNANPSGSGTLTPAIGSHQVAAGTTLAVQAAAKSGYIFDHWTGPVLNPNSATTSVLVNSNMTLTAHFVSTTQYSLTMAASPQQGGVVIPAVGTYQYSAGTVVNIQAIANNGYEFVSWSGQVADPSNPATSVTMNQNQTVIAIFQQVSNTTILTVVADPINGGTTGPAPGSHSYTLGATVQVTAIPASGYQFSGWSGQVESPASITTNVIMTTNKTVTAHFSKITTDRVELTIQSTPTEGGSTIPNSGMHAYNLNSTVQLIAVPAPGYEFVSWVGQVADTQNDTTQVLMDQNKTVTAVFNLVSKPQVVLSISASPAGYGTTVPVPGIYTFSKGDTVELAAQAFTGYAFEKWLGDVENPSATNTKIILSENKAVVAMYQKASQKKVSLNILVNPPNSGFTAPPIGTYEYTMNEVVNLTSVPVSGYQFVSWSGGVEDSTQRTTRVTMTGDKTIIANFESLQATQYPLHISVSPFDAGSTLPEIGTHYYDENETVSLLAIPKNGYTFSHWEGTVANPTQATTTTMMSAERTIKAVFTKTECTLSLSVTPLQAGTTTPSVGDTSITCGATCQILAKEKTGYRFVYWSGDAAGTANPMTITMDNDKNIIANFVQVQETISKPKITGSSTAIRYESVDFYVQGSASNLGHELEYQFDFGNGKMSDWGPLKEQTDLQISNITTQSGNNGLPGSGHLVNYTDGQNTNVMLSVNGGIYQNGMHAALGANPVSGTDAWNVFDGKVDCRGVISYNNLPGSPLIFTLTGMNPDMKYSLVYYSNRDNFGWDEASIITLYGADSFTNASSAGKDNYGQPLFAGSQSPSTRLPADNTYTGYVARFTEIKPGVDGGITLIVNFSGMTGHEYKGKYANALQLVEMHPTTNLAQFTAYNDFAWDSGLASNTYNTSGTYPVKVRARCKTHPAILSEWSDPFAVTVAGALIETTTDPLGAFTISKIPNEPDYDYGSLVTLVAQPAPGYLFSHWNEDVTDTLAIKLVHTNNSKSFIAHFQSATAVLDRSAGIPKEFSLGQNYPNPFNPSTNIRYDVPTTARVSIKIYDIQGRLVRTLLDADMAPGSYRAIWDAENNNGQKVATGLYFYRMQANSFQSTKRMIILK